MEDDHYLVAGLGLLAGICSIASFVLGVSHVVGYVPALSGTVLFMTIFLMLVRSFVVRAPVYCIRTEVHIRIIDSSGKTVKSEKTQKFITLGRNIARLIENVTTDGMISSVKADIVSDTSSVRLVKKNQGLQVWHHEFERELKHFRWYTRKFEVTYNESFTQDREYYDIFVNYPGKDLILIIHFPQDRHPTLVQRIETIGAIVLNRGSLEVQQWQTPQEAFVEWHIKWPRMGHKYTIEWQW